jgi:hypothetical protein
MAKSDPEALLVQTALKALERQRWSELTLAGVARAAKLPLAEAIAIVPSKPVLACVLLRWTAREAARRFRPDRNARDPRERVLDAAMAWFDVLESRWPAFAALCDGFRSDPLTLIGLRSDVTGVAEVILALAEADFGPLAGGRAVALTGILAHAVAVWRDDDAEMGKTMATLDRDLRRAAPLLWPRQDRAARTTSRRGRRSKI